MASKQKLAALLGVSLRDLLFLLKQPDNYRLWGLPHRRRDALAGIPHKPRDIQQPKPLLALLHRRLAVLLGRIEKPAYVYSATKSRSYLDNAKQHATNHRAVKVDIKNFYPNVKRKFVRDFFGRELKCAPDVAHVLTDLCCLDTVPGSALPTGSAASPVLSFFACSAMFREIAELANRHGLTFTLYVDDMVFSGEKANRNFTTLVVHALAKNGFVGHKITHFGSNTIKIITGVAVSSGNVDLPHRRQRRIRKFEEAFWASKNHDDIQLLGITLLGQYREAERIKSGSKLRALPIVARLEKLGLATTGVGATTANPKKPRGKRVSAKRFATLREAATRAAAPAASDTIAGSVAEAA
ncbi:MAG: reverse transcriptase family protein [Lysobacter sp.]